VKVFGSSRGSPETRLRSGEAMAGPAPATSTLVRAPPWDPPWTERLRQDPTVLEIIEPVSPRLEMTRHLLAHPHRRVWFRGLTGPSVAGNLWATRGAIAQALGTTPEDLVGRLLKSWDERRPGLTVPIAQAGWKSTSTFDLTNWPIPWLYPGDAGPYLTAGVFCAAWKGQRNSSFHRFLVRRPREGPIRVVPRHLDRMIQDARREGRELPVALVLGGPLEFLLAAATTTDYGVDEMEIASSLREMRTGRPLPVVELGNGVRVPAEAELVLEGRVTSRDEPEGPFLDILGTYDPERSQPVVVFDRLHAVPEPVIPVIVPGGDEHFLLMGIPREPAIYRSVRSAVPGVHQVRLTEGGCAWLHGIVSVEKRREGDGRNAILAAFTGHPSLKRVIVVDSDIDIFDDREVEWALATRFQADQGLVLVPGATGSSLDPSAGPDSRTTKWGLDATLPLGRDRKPFQREKYFARSDPPGRVSPAQGSSGTSSSGLGATSGGDRPS
jgi:UbiD family decarboxylase